MSAATQTISLPLKTRRRFDVQLLLALTIAMAVLLPRSWKITHAQSERFDDEYHIRHGAQFLADHYAGTNPRLNDPPLGEALTVLPLWLAHCWPGGGPKPGSAIWDQHYGPDTIMNIIGLWKSLLLLPMIALAFIWVRGLYGLKAAWLSVALFLIEPTIAAHTPLPSIDVLGMEGIVIACFLIWRYFQQPGWSRLTVASFATGVAMLIKHTAVILPVVWVAFAIMWWVIRPWREGDLPESWRGRIRKRIVAIIAVAVIIWFTICALLMFDVRKPAVPRGYPMLARLLNHRMPGALYITSFFQAAQHAQTGHEAFLLGKIRMTGFWYYFPIVATYKIPLGIGLLLVAGFASLFWRRIKWDEWGLFVPAVMWTGLMMSSNVDIGWRHFLPAYAFMMLISTRLLVEITRGWVIAAWVLVALALGDTLRWNPDYISYIAWPRHDGWRDISDSNIDWGQGLKYVRQWLLKHPGKTEVYVHSYAWRPTMEHVRKRLGPRVTLIDRARVQLPTSGILLISPVSIVGDYETGDPWRALRKIKPMAVLGHSVFVYDLDALSRDRPFNWGVRLPKPTTAPATQTTSRPSTRRGRRG